MATTQKLLITGTSPEVGKTIVSAVIAQALDATYWKPIECGVTADSDFVRNHTSCRVFEGVFKSEQATLVNVALRTEGKSLKLPFKVPNVKPLVIESLSGILSPITDAGETLLDAIHPMEVDVIIVANQNNETVHQVGLICQNLQWLGFNILGVVYNGVEDIENEKLIEQMNGVRNKYHIAHMDTVDKESISKAVAEMKMEILKWIK